MDLKPVGSLLAAAGGVVAIVFGLFGGVLRSLAPPSAQMEPALLVGIVSIAALLILLIAALLIPTRILSGQRKWVAGVSACLGVVAFLTLWGYVSTLSKLEFRYPDTAVGDRRPQRYVRGEYTVLGRQITGHMSVAAAIDSVGGLEIAKSHQLLWSEETQKANEMRLAVLYFASIGLLTAALFSGAVAVLRTGKSKSGPPRK